MTIPNTVQHPASVDAYIRHGWSLVPIPPGTKGPRTVGWNRRESALRSQADLPPQHGIGLSHAYSATMALDIDNWATAAPMLGVFGVDLAALYDAPDAVIVDSGRQGHGKLLYAMPFGLALPSKKVSVEGGTSFELRCATAEGLTVQDVLPPSIHPDTQQPYRWAGRGHWMRLPLIPPALVDLWQALLDEPAPEPVQPTESIEVNWDEIRSALDSISPDVSRDEWITCGMALHWAGTQTNDLDGAFTTWQQWSAKSVEKYPGDRAIGAQWRSFKSDKATQVKLGSLFHLARQSGWVKPPVDASALFKPAEALTEPQVLIESSRVPAPVMRVEWWPQALADRATEVSEHIGCDPIVPLFSGLAAVAGAIDARSRLRLMEGYEVPPIIWLMTIGSPADKKTPGASPMVEVLHQIEAEDYPAFKKRMLDWEALEARHAVSKKEFLDAASSLDVTGNTALPTVSDLPPQPQPLRLKVSDITSQKLVRYAAERPRGLLCYLDEMAAWTKKMSDRNSGEDRSTWVQAYEARRYEYDRVGGGAIIAECFAVSVYGNIQPLVYRATVEALATDGLLQRFIPGILDTRKTRRGEPGPPAHSAGWDQLVRLVYSLPAQTYTLAPDAFTLFREFQLWFEQSKRDEVVLEADPAFLTAYGKLEGTAARLALLFHVIETPFSSIVSRSTLEQAISMVRGYVIPALRYTLAEFTGDSFDIWVQGWLLYHCAGKTAVTLSEVKRGARRRMEKVQSAILQDRMVIGAMQTLEEAGWVVRLDDGSREHLHQAEWAINPALVNAFDKQRTEIIKARQRAEDERRTIAGLERRTVPHFEEWMDEEDEKDQKAA